MSVHDRKNLKSALESAILYLQKQGVEEARQDAWLLLEHVCGISHSTYFVHSCLLYTSPSPRDRG